MADASGQTATDAREVGPPASPPAYRSGISQQTWDEFNQAVADLPGITPTEQYVYAKIFAGEGGAGNDPNSSASSGILRQALRDAQAANVPGLDGVANPRDLTIEQRTILYQFYTDRAFHTVGGGAALDTIPDPQTAAAVADTLFRHGNSGGAGIVQKSINDVIGGLPADERQRLGVSSVDLDGAMGPETFDTARKLDQSGYGPALRGKIADNRLKLTKNPNEKSRFDDFR